MAKTCKCGMGRLECAPQQGDVRLVGKLDRERRPDLVFQGSKQENVDPHAPIVPSELLEDYPAESILYKQDLAPNEGVTPRLESFVGGQTCPKPNSASRGSVRS